MCVCVGVRARVCVCMYMDEWTYVRMDRCTYERRPTYVTYILPAPDVREAEVTGLSAGSVDPSEEALPFTVVASPVRVSALAPPSEVVASGTEVDPGEDADEVGAAVVTLDVSVKFRTVLPFISAVISADVSEEV